MRISHLWILLALSLAPGRPATASDLIIGTGEWVPYYGEALENGGLGASLTRAVFERMGHSTQHQFVPWKRVWSHLDTGKVIAGDCAWDSPARRSISHFADEPLMQNDLVVLRRRDAGWQFEKLEDLNEKRVATVLGYNYGNRLARNPAIQQAVSPNLNSSIRQVHARRVDFLIEAREVLDYLLAGEFRDLRDELTIDPTPFETRYCYLAFRKTDEGKRFAEQFSKTLRAMKADGSYDAIMSSAITWETACAEDILDASARSQSQNSCSP